MESSTGSVRRGCFHSGARGGWVFGCGIVTCARRGWRPPRRNGLSAALWYHGMAGEGASMAASSTPLPINQTAVMQRSCRPLDGALHLQEFKIRSGATSLTTSRESREGHIVLLGQRQAGMSSSVVMKNTQAMLCCRSYPCQKRVIIQHILRDKPNHKPNQYQAQSCQPFRSHCWAHACLVKPRW